MVKTAPVQMKKFGCIPWLSRNCVLSCGVFLATVDTFVLLTPTHVPYAANRCKFASSLNQKHRKEGVREKN